MANALDASRDRMRTAGLARERRDVRSKTRVVQSVVLDTLG